MKIITQKQVDHVADTAQIIASNQREHFELQFNWLFQGRIMDFAFDAYNEAYDDYGGCGVVIYAAVEQSLRCGVLPKGWVLK